jgi:hypothetical protein
MREGMRFNPERYGGETGRLYEEKLLGKIEVDDEFASKEKALPRDYRGHYQSDDLIYNLVKEHQPVDEAGESELPQTAVDILEEVRLGLGLKAEEYESVQFYTAVGTPIDYKLGVDGWIEFTDPHTGRTSRVTLDVTKNERKLAEGHFKADEPIPMLPDAIQEEDEYFAAVESIGRAVAAKLQKRLSDIEA